MDYHLRYMLPQDVELVKQIDHEAFPSTWPRPQFKRELSSKNTRYLVISSGQSPNYPYETPLDPESLEGPVGIKARFLRLIFPKKNSKIGLNYPGEKILGFVGILLSGDEAHVTAIATEETNRGMGIGELLLVGVIELSWLEEMQMVTLEVRVSNHIAQSLYAKYGFLEQGIRKRYYLDNHEDAMIMSTPSINSSEYRESFNTLVKTHELRWGNSCKIFRSS